MRDMKLGRVERGTKDYLTLETGHLICNFGAPMRNQDDLILEIGEIGHLSLRSDFVCFRGSS